MSTGPRYRVHFRRRREGKTDYRVRLRLLKSGTPRAVVRFSDRVVRVSIVTFDPVGDRVVAAADSRELGAIAFPPSSLASTPAAYLTAYLAGLRAKASGTETAALDAGVEIPHGEKGFPTADRLNGTHLAKPLPEPVEAYKLKLPALAVRPEVSA